MRTAESDTIAGLTGSFQYITYADAWYNGEQTVEGLPVSGGTIEWDITADIASQLNLIVSDPSGRLIPHAPTDPLSPYGQEINVSAALVSSGQQQSEPISLGWWRIQEPRTKARWMKTPTGTYRSGGAVVTLTALDRMAILADARFLTVDQPSVGATVLGEITRLVEDLVPLGDVDPALSDHAVPLATVYQDDRVAALNELARSIGGSLFFDSNGLLQVRKPTQAGATPVWTFGIGAGGTVVDYEMVMSRDGVVNCVVATGEADGDHAPVMGIAYDLDASSPTNFAGPFGEVPLFYSSPLLMTPAAAAAAAATRLNDIRRGRDREYVVNVVPNFLIELDDPVVISLPDRTIAGRVVKISLPLTPAQMVLTVRALDIAVTTLET